ncbi:MAG: hypothetical protein JSR61_21795, partial [Proteobacteria bacterium]|nr:hypothetical protein [Pseudomonadota bacterium]
MAATLCLLAGAALADGGGGSGGNTTYGGTGGADSSTGAGAGGGASPAGQFGGGGGGGAGQTGGSGSAGDGGVGGAGGSGGASVGANGQDGSDSASGGGGGGGGAHGAVSATLPSVAGTGGNGGAGGSGTGNSDGGGGGGGGYGVVVTGSGNLGALGVTTTGGKGGAGGTATVPTYLGGNGGTGGIGLLLTNAAGATFTVNGTIQGGNGGAGGAGLLGATAGTAGAGGAGLVGENLNITIGSSGSVIGGLSGDGTTRANAMTFTGGTNALTLTTGSTLVGNAVAFSAADTVTLNGSTSGSIDVSQLQGFGGYTKTGTGTWVLTGGRTGTATWAIDGGILSVGTLTSFTPAPTSSGLGLGAVTLAGGELLTTTTGSLANDLSFANNKTSILAAATGTTLTLGGDPNISGNTATNFTVGSNAVIQFGTTSDTGTIRYGASSQQATINGLSSVVIGGGRLQDFQDSLWWLLANVTSLTVNAGATLDYNDSTNQVIVNLSGAGSVISGSTGSNALTIYGTTGSTNLFSGVISGSHPVSFNTTGGAATMILTGDNTYTGGTTICFCATLQLGNG